MAARLIYLAAGALLAGCTAQQVVDVPPPASAGVARGKPVTCLTQHRIDGQRVVDKRTILFRIGRQWYRNDLPYECPALKDDAIIVTRSTNGESCSGDIIRLVDRSSGFDLGSCAYGQFTPVDLPKNAR